MRTGAAYIRVSTDEQLEFSPDSQLKKIEEYAAAQNICLPSEYIFREDGISGRKAERRPAFQRMIAAAKVVPRPFDVILVWKYSRFARSRSDSIFYKTLLREKLGIDVLSVSEPVGKDKTAKIYESIIEVMDEYYCDNLSEEVKRGMEERFSRGRIIAPPPFGYRVCAGIYVPDGERADAVREIFSRFAGGMSQRAIAMELNNSGLRTKKGRRFEMRTVGYILRNPVYLGYVRKRGEDGAQRLILGEHVPLVDPALFAACADRLAQDGGTRPYVREAARFPLSGLIRCSACGSTLTMSSRVGRLQCCAYAKGKCSVSHSVGLEQITEAVMEKLSVDLAGIVVHICASPFSSEKNLGAATLRRESLRLRRIEEAYEAGVYTLEYLAAAKEEYQKKEAMCRKQEEETVLQPIDAKLELLDLLRFAVAARNGEFANAILKGILSEIIFDREKNTVQIIYSGNV